MSQPHRRGMSITTLIGTAALAVAVVGGSVYVARQGGAGEGQARGAELAYARVGSFDITVPAAGELAAQTQVEVASQLERQATITDIVAEGTFVRKGEMLIHLDDEEIVNLIRDTELEVDQAEAALASAQSALDVKKVTSESALALAQVDIDLAELALKSWEEGEDKSERERLALELETAEKDFERLERRFEASKDLLKDEFISEDEFRRDEIELIRAKSRLDQARTSVDIYDRYDSVMQSERLQSDIQKAKDRFTENQERYRSEIEAQEREVESRKYTLERRREDLEKAKRQFDLCTIVAPQDGLVVYASSLNRDRRGGEDPPEVGSELRRNRTVIVLPDTSRMVAEVKVNEALAGRVQPGQRVIVNADALPNHPIEGTVQSVGVLAEGGGWRDPNRRDYTVRVALEDTEGLGLKPSMRCKSEIYVGSVDDALHVPIAAVFREGGDAFVFTPDAGGYSARPVRVGRASELFIEVRDGLAENDAVLVRRPTPDEIVVGIQEAMKTLEAEREAAVADGRAPAPEGERRGGPPAGMRRGGPGGPPAAVTASRGG